MDEDMKHVLKRKIENGELAPADIPAYLNLFCEMGNELEAVAALAEDWNQRILLDLHESGSFWLIIVDGRFTTGEGLIENPELTLTMRGDDAALIFSGEKDAQAAFMAGDLQVAGQLPDALRLHALIEAVSEEIEN